MPAGYVQAGGRRTRGREDVVQGTGALTLLEHLVRIDAELRHQLVHELLAPGPGRDGLVWGGLLILALIIAAAPACGSVVVCLLRMHASSRPLMICPSRPSLMGAGAAD